MSAPSRAPDLGKGGIAALFGAATAMIVCCALGPAVIATGLLSALAALGRNPLVIAVAAIALVATAVLLIRRRRVSSSDSKCCPEQDPPSAAQLDETTQPRGSKQ